MAFPQKPHVKHKCSRCGHELHCMPWCTGAVVYLRLEQSRKCGGRACWWHLDWAGEPYLQVHLWKIQQAYLGVTEIAHQAFCRVQLPSLTSHQTLPCGGSFFSDYRMRSHFPPNSACAGFLLGSKRIGLGGVFVAPLLPRLAWTCLSQLPIACLAGLPVVSPLC